MLSHDDVDFNSTSIRLHHQFSFSPAKNQNQSTISNVPDILYEEPVEDKVEFKEPVKETVKTVEQDLSVKKTTTVIFGTSITRHIEEKKLAGKGQRCINVSQSGAKIRDISHMFDEFIYKNEHAGDVANIIFNIGVNDIKYEKFGVDKYREPILSLLNKAKLHYPFAKIMIFSTLPMKNMYRYTVKNFLRFNQILEQCTIQCNCIFVDCFWHFLTYDKRDINRELYSWDGLHLNTAGIYFLGCWMHYMINMKSFTNVISHIPT